MKSAYLYNKLYVSIIFPDSVTSIGEYAFYDCNGLRSVVIPDGVTSIESSTFFGCTKLVRLSIGNGITRIGPGAFYNCRELASITIGSQVASIGQLAFSGCDSLSYVVFCGDVPGGLTSSGLLDNVKAAKWGRQFGSEYINAGLQLSKFAGFVPEEDPVKVVIVSSSIRENDPTVIDIGYKVTSCRPTVNVRALAFEDGVRSFAKVVRPETFVNDTDGNPTAQNIGDGIETNVVLSLAWKVSADWATRLSKVRFDILARDRDLLPLEVQDFPADERHGKIQVSWNVIMESQIFDALMWLYADKAEGLTLEDGVLKAGGKTLARGTELVDGKGAAEFVYRAMGFDGVLSDELLNYVNEETRLGLEPDGVRQYAYKFIEE